ncbi:N-acetylmuramoyl-L-alanine amidase [Paracoccus versutus]
MMETAILQYLGPPMMRGPMVLLLQLRLAQLALLPIEGVDGLFGPQTAQAVRALQARMRLPITGALEADLARQLIAGLADDARPELSASSPLSTMASPAGLGAQLQPGLRPPRHPRPRPAERLRAVPADQLPNARPKRIILHWTAGNARASTQDLQHYHFCIEQDGTIRRGNRTIADNDSTADGRYAAHTRQCNTRSVGLALCGMAGAQERPFRAGRAPIREAQIPVLARLAAQICQRYDIPVSRETVLAHGEVQSILKIPQNGKWDPLVLPWRPELSPREVGDLLRAEVAQALASPAADPVGGDEAPGRFPLFINGREVAGGGIPEDGEDWVPLAPLLEATGWQSESPEGLSSVTLTGPAVLIRAGEATAWVDLRTEAGMDLIFLDDLVEELDLSLSIEPDGTRQLKGDPGGGFATLDGTRFQRVTVARGDTLRAIARHHLGDPELWRQIRDPDGQVFNESTARTLAAGIQVLVPVVPAAKPAAPTGPMDAAAFAEIAQAVSQLTHRLNKDAAQRAVPIILAACLAEGITDPSHLAYVLATAEHETNFGRQMIEKWGNPPSANQQRYQGRFGNIHAGDGKRFRGRGYVQLTFRDNYRRFGKAIDLPLEDNPDLAAEEETAARLMAIGMGRLGYTRGFPVLATFGSGENFDFTAARRIINGDGNTKTDRYPVPFGQAIGGRAQAYATVLLQRLL